MGSVKRSVEDISDRLEEEYKVFEEAIKDSVCACIESRKTAQDVFEEKTGFSSWEYFGMGHDEAVRRHFKRTAKWGVLGEDG